MTYWPSKLFAVVDTETTGLDFDNDRVIQASVAIFNGGQYVTGYEWLSNVPTPSHPDAVATHGITDEYRAENGEEAPLIMGRLFGLIKRLRHTRSPIMMFNSPFDMTMLRMEFLRTGFNWRTDDLYVIDPLVIDRHYQKHIPVFTKPWMRLGQMAARYGVQAPEHRALADAVSTGHIAIAQSFHHPPLRRLSLPELQRNQVKWYGEWATVFRTWGAKKGISFNIPAWPYGNGAETPEYAQDRLDFGGPDLRTVPDQ